MACLRTMPVIYVVSLSFGLIAALPANAQSLSDIFDGVQTSINRAQEARDASEEIRDQVREGVAAITGQVQTAIGNAVDDLKRVVAQELDGLAEFVEGGSGCSEKTCEPFRENLLTLLESIETISNCLFVITELDQVQIDLGREIGIIEGLPGRALFPLYRVLGQESDLFEFGLVAQLNDLADNLLELKGLVIDTACGPVWDDPQRATTIVRRITTAASTMILIGRGMISAGETNFSGDAGIHGYVHLNVLTNELKKWGERLVGLGQTVLPVVQFGGRKVDYCISLLDQEQLKTAIMEGIEVSLEEVLKGQAVILEAIRGNADLNFDGQINLIDFAIFQQRFGG